MRTDEAMVLLVTHTSDQHRMASLDLSSPAILQACCTAPPPGTPFAFVCGGKHEPGAGPCRQRAGSDCEYVRRPQVFGCSAPTPVGALCCSRRALVAKRGRASVSATSTEQPGGKVTSFIFGTLEATTFAKTCAAGSKPGSSIAATKIGLKSWQHCQIRTRAKVTPFARLTKWLHL